MSTEPTLRILPLARRTPWRIDQIDTLRGISIIAVILHHINLRVSFERSTSMQLLPHAIRQDMGWNGHYGVILFFCVSGFLITSTCLRRWESLDALSVKKFYRIRFARIVPLLVGVLILLSFLHLLHVSNFFINPQRASLGRALFAAATFHINWLESSRGYLPANWDVMWSLSNEEVFYLLFPWVCVLLRKTRTISLLLAVFILLGPFARTLFTQNEIWASKGYLSCMDVIAIGCLAALVARHQMLPRHVRRTCVFTGVLLVGFVSLCRDASIRMALPATGLDVTIIAVGTGLMCIAFLQNDRTGHSIWEPIRWFGRNSYEVYLTHMMVIFPALWIVRKLDPRVVQLPLYILLITILAGTLGAGIARYYSEPLRRRLLRGQS